MPVERYNPAGLFQPTGYSQVTVAVGRRVVFVSGQVAIDAAGHLVGAGDLGAQAQQAFRNLVAALGSVGAAVTDIAKMTLYVVNYIPDLHPTISQARREAFGAHIPASTLVGVPALADPGFLIEVEVIAVLD